MQEFCLPLAGFRDGKKAFSCVQQLAQFRTNEVNSPCSICRKDPGPVKPHSSGLGVARALPPACETVEVGSEPEAMESTGLALGLQVPSEKVFGVGLEGPNTEPEEVRLEP